MLNEEITENKINDNQFKEWLVDPVTIDFKRKIIEVIEIMKENQSNVFSMKDYKEAEILYYKSQGYNRAYMELLSYVQEENEVADE